MSEQAAREQRRGGAVLVELVRLVVVGVCTAIGFQVARAIVADPESARTLVGALLGSSVGYVLGGMLGRTVGRLLGLAEEHLSAMSGADLVAGGGGAVLGVVIGTVIGLPLLALPSRSVGLASIAFVQIILGYLGFRVGLGKREDLLQLFGLTYRTRASDLRVLDTSAVLHPQLLDFVRAGVIRGTVLLPTFVLEEAQGIADHSDQVRRNRASRGLEALGAIKREGLIEVRTVDKTYPEFDEVDAKVLALARERGASIVTDDAPLAKVAEVQGIEVFHLRRIAAALRPPVLPGEAMQVEIVRTGTEPGQGVGYLDDGTMVVVADAAARVGSTVDVVASRIVQTSGGQLVFATLGAAS